MTTTAELLVRVCHAGAEEQPPSLADVIRKSRNQPCAAGTGEYLAERPEIAMFAHALNIADSVLKEHTAVAAYYIWVQGGRGHGKDKQDWFQAEKQLRKRLHPDLFDADGNLIVGAAV